MTKPRPGWTIAEGGATALRPDGVVAGYFFSDRQKPYAIQRPFEGPRGRRMEWLSGGRTGGTPRCFGTLDKAMDAADKVWGLR